MASKDKKKSNSSSNASLGDGMMGLFGYRGGGDKPRKKQVIQYDKEGNVLGDDGLPMTPTRKRMHRILDAWFIYLFVLLVAGFVLMIMAYMQGAEYTDWNLVQRGGNQYNGWDTALLMRLEALLCVFSAVFAVLINLFGFQWLYDRKPPTMVYAMFIALGLACVGYLIFGITAVGTPEPLSLVNISFMLITILAMRAVAAERPHLRKPKIGRREIR